VADELQLELIRELAAAQMRRAHKRNVEDRSFGQKGKGAPVQFGSSPQSVLELSSFNSPKSPGSDF